MSKRGNGYGSENRVNILKKFKIDTKWNLYPAVVEPNGKLRDKVRARGEMENRIKEQLSLFADRMSTETLRANQLRLYFSSLAYALVEALRRLGLAGTEWAEAQADTSGFDR